LHVFPYREEEEVKGIRVLRPTFDIDISTRAHQQRTKALVDTGALRCLFALGVARAIGIRFSSLEQPDLIADVGGASRPVALRTVTLALPDDSTIHWETEVGFVLEEWDMDYGLLGHAGFLDRFVVSFNYANNYFAIETPESWENRTPPPDPFEEHLHRGDPEWERPRLD